MTEPPGYKNGKYIGTKNQHIVPQLHLINFSNENNIIYVTSIENGNTFPENISNISSSDWVYDYNPEESGSMENCLRKDELWMGNFIRSILDSKIIPKPKDLIQYVSYLNARSLGIMEAIRTINTNNPREKMKEYYENRKHLLNGNDPASFDAFILTISRTDIQFITSDHPFYMQDIRGSEINDRLHSGETYFAPEWRVAFCPISSKKCIVIIPKGITHGSIIKGIKNKPILELVDIINTNLAYYADTFIYGLSDPSQYYHKASALKEHPDKNEFHTNLKSFIKENKKNHTPLHL